MKVHSFQWHVVEDIIAATHGEVMEERLLFIEQSPGPVIIGYHGFDLTNPHIDYFSENPESIASALEVIRRPPGIAPTPLEDDETGFPPTGVETSVYHGTFEVNDEVIRRIILLARRAELSKNLFEREARNIIKVALETFPA